MGDKHYELSITTKNNLKTAQTNYEAAVSDALPIELEDSKSLAISQLKVKPKSLYLWARLELE